MARMANPDTGDDTRINVVKGLALIVGILFTIIGLAGFAVTGFDQFAQRTGETLLGFEINPLHNIVHLILGVLGLVMWSRLSWARAYGWLLVVGYGAVLIWGLFSANRDETDGNLLSLNTADNWLHAATVVVGLIIALLPVRRAVGRDERDETVDVRDRTMYRESGTSVSDPIRRTDWTRDREV